MSTHVASAQLVQVDEVVQPKRQRHAVPDPQGELSSQGVWFRRSWVCSDDFDNA